MECIPFRRGSQFRKDQLAINISVNMDIDLDNNTDYLRSSGRVSVVLEITFLSGLLRTFDGNGV